LLFGKGFIKTYSTEYDKPSIIPFRKLDLFLAQKIKLLVTARTRIDDGGKVARKIVGVTTVAQRKGKGDLQRDLGRPMILPSFQG